MRVVLADDSALFREAIGTVLEGAGHVVVAQVADAEQLLRVIEGAGGDALDVAVIDVRMPPSRTTEGLEAALRIREIAPDVGLLILSQDVQTRHVVELLRDSPEGVGYLLKERVGNLADFLGAVDRVGTGGSVIDPEVVSILLGRARPHGALDDLTLRELDVLELMAEGRSNMAIAERLGLAERTIESVVGAIFSKLGLEPATTDHRRVLAVLAYLREA